MPRILLILLLLTIYVPKSFADEMDLLTGEFIIGDTADADVSIAADDSPNPDGMFGFIVNPIKNLFTNDEAEASPEANTDKKEPPLQKAIRLADEGDLQNQLNLGYMYLYGQDGVPQDFDKAFKYYQMAAEQNDATAVNNLASLYFNGIGTKKDIEKSIELFEKAADLGSDSAAVNLAFMYLSGSNKDSIRNEKAFRLFEKASNEGNKIAQFMLGYAYYKGFTTTPNYKSAFKLIKSAAGGEAQIDEAQIVLAELYTQGFGTVQNYGKALAACRAAAAQGNAEAAAIVADIYDEGKMVNKQKIQAHAFYNIAASMGDAIAAQKREQMAKEMEIGELQQAHEIAENFAAEPSELTTYIHQTFGERIRSYIDNNMTDMQ